MKTINIPYIIMVDVNRVVVKKDINRPINMDRVQKIVENFDPRVVTPLKVTRTMDEFGLRYIILDGQHTFTALSKLGYLEVPCIALDISEEEYAKLLCLFNRNKKNMSTQQLTKSFKNSVGEPGKLMIKRLKQLGITTTEDVFEVYELWKSKSSEKEFLNKVANYKKLCFDKEHKQNKLYCGKHNGAIDFIEFYKNN